MNNFEMIIGVEVHAELNTKKKIFSPAINNINSKPNTNIHPIDLAIPGTLPRFNEEVLQKSLKIAHALKMDISKTMHWDRKNYFYHDNPKGYQITQFETPIGRSGKITLDNGKNIGITFMHMEEDTAKTFNENGKIKLDFNRCGVPLVEIVSDPVLRSPVETREYLEKLREILVYLDVSDGRLEEGSFRVDVNVSIRPYGTDELRTKVEIKNLNSFNNVQKAIEQEVKNQIKEFLYGEETLQTTKRLDENTGELIVMRVKEGSADYRYFPEPDLPLIELTEEYCLKQVENRPLLPNEIRTILVEKNNLPKKEVDILLTDRKMALFFLETLQFEKLSPKQTLNYLVVNVNEFLNKNKLSFVKSELSIENLLEINDFLLSGKISTNHVKKIIPMLCLKKQNAGELIKEMGIEQISDPIKIKEIVEETIEENPESIELYKSGKNKAFGFLVGKTIAKSKGQANPKMVNEILLEVLNKIT